MTTQTPPLPIIDGHFFIDNSSLEHYTTCRRSYEYHDVHRRVGKDQRAGLVFGGLLHSCLELRYRWEGETGLSPIDVRFDKEVEARQFALIEEFYRRDDLPSDLDYRTAAYAQECMILYNRYYITEPFAVAKDTTGNPLVEVPFSFELGKVVYPRVVNKNPFGHVVSNDTITVMWIGKIDLVAVWDKTIVMHGDHKSAKSGGDWFFRDYDLDQGQRGYAWALQKVIGRPVPGFFINGLVCRKPSKTGQTFEFIRRRFSLDADTLVEWQENTLRLVEDIFRDSERDYFPMETRWCNGKYGPCQYRQVCDVSRQGRRPLLYGGLFTENTWSPLNKPEVNQDGVGFEAPV